jgi:hypothetical protein
LIIDLGSTLDPTTEETRELSREFRLLAGRPFLKIALVVSKEFHFGIGRMAEVFTDPDGETFKVFKNEGEAKAWLKGTRT